ncbi:hypothetical protein AB0O34_20820 [Sphaerisporangium sp. NPDC088356]|uniref:hypothetical protein n=1 Tax=Sphaerisporangium sp. NPDC088356 TaxID=3154871 RepID=UPI003449C47A
MSGQRGIEALLNGQSSVTSPSSESSASSVDSGSSTASGGGAFAPDSGGTVVGGPYAVPDGGSGAHAGGPSGSGQPQGAEGPVDPSFSGLGHLDGQGAPFSPGDPAGGDPLYQVTGPSYPEARDAYPQVSDPADPADPGGPIDPGGPADLAGPNAHDPYGSTQADPYSPDSVDPNVPDPNVPDPNVPDPNIPDPNVPDPNVPDPNIPDPNIPDPNIPDVPVPNVPDVPDPSIPDIPNPNVPTTSDPSAGSPSGDPGISLPPAPSGGGGGSGFPNVSGIPTGGKGTGTGTGDGKGDPGATREVKHDAVIDLGVKIYNGPGAKAEAVKKEPGNNHIGFLDCGAVGMPISGAHGGVCAGSGSYIEAVRKQMEIWRDDLRRSGEAWKLQEGDVLKSLDGVKSELKP